MRYIKESLTSYQGAIDNLPRSGTQRRLILDTIANSGGLTREEIEILTELSGNAVRPRVAELIEAGLVKETERTRETRSGSQAAVLVVNVGSSTESQGGVVASAEGSNPSLGVASGVEASSSLPVRDDAPPATQNPYEAELWA